MTMHLVSWNVAGRVEKLTRQAKEILHGEPAILALQEITRKTLPLWREKLASRGYEVLSSFDNVADEESLTGGRRYGNLTASRWRILRSDDPIINIPWPERVVSSIIETPKGSLELHNAHLPAGVSHGWIKIETFEGIYERLAVKHIGHRVLCGDFNSPKEENPDGSIVPFGGSKLRWTRGELSVMNGLRDFDLPDVYRELNGIGAHEWSWSGQNRGKRYGRRFDHIFASRSMSPVSCRYIHTIREAGLSDHSPIKACFDP